MLDFTVSGDYDWSMTNATSPEFVSTAAVLAAPSVPGAAPVRAIARWRDAYGNTYTQGHATVDNRPSRVFRRLEIMGWTVETVWDLEIEHVR
jgi:hypothetical protein